MEVVASLSQARTAAVQCGLFTHKSVPVIFEPPCTFHCYNGTPDLYWRVGAFNYRHVRTTFTFLEKFTGYG